MENLFCIIIAPVITVFLTLICEHYIIPKIKQWRKKRHDKKHPPKIRYIGDDNSDDE